MTVQVFPDERGLVLDVADPAPVLQAIPTAFQLGEHEVGMPHGDAEVRQLLQMGIYAPPPIVYYYDWPRDRAHVKEPFAHQIVTSSFLTINSRSYCLNDIGCVDATTEYLSPTGWHPMDDYRGEKVAQYNLDGTMEFVQPAAYVKKPCTEMIRLKTKYGVDQLLSPDHTVLYVASAGGRMTVPASTVEQIYRDSACGWPGRFITTFTPKLDTRMDITDAQLRVMVAVIADGYFPNGSKRCIVRLKKQRKKIRLRALLKEAGITWKEKDPEYKSAPGFTVFSFHAPIKAKVFGPEFWQSSLAQLHVVADEAVHWDGSARKAGLAAFTSYKKESADFVQYAYAATGRTAYLSTKRPKDGGLEYTVLARAKAALLYLKGAGLNGKCENVWREASPDGFMYCFNVPSGFLILRRNGCIFATGNTGKTLSACWAADYVMNLEPGTRALITAPLSTLERVWGDTLFFHFRHRKFVVLHGTAARRRRMLAQPADFYIINHDGVGVIQKDLAARNDIGIFILDELAIYRNQQTAKWKALNALIFPTGKPAKRWVWGFTGAPIPNSPTDAYGQYRLVTPASGPKFFTQFRNMTMEHQSTYVWTPRKEALNIVHKVMRPAIRYRRDECLDLPPEIHSTRQVEMSSEQQKHYKAIMREMYTEVQGGKVTAMNEGVKLSKLLQIACGVVYDTDGTPREIDAGNRIETLLELIEQVDEKVIIYVPFTAVTGMLARELNKHWNFAVVTGDTPIKERNQIFSDFQSPKDIDIIAHPGCMSHGLTLTEASTIIWYAPIDSNDTYGQANGRITRASQKYTANIIHLSGSTVERRTYKRLEQRQSTQGVLLEMVEKGEQ